MHDVLLTRVFSKLLPQRTATADSCQYVGSFCGGSHSCPPWGVPLVDYYECVDNNGYWYSLYQPAGCTMFCP